VFPQGLVSVRTAVTSSFGREAASIDRKDVTAQSLGLLWAGLYFAHPLAPLVCNYKFRPALVLCQVESIASACPTLATFDAEDADRWIVFLLSFQPGQCPVSVLLVQCRKSSSAMNSGTVSLIHYANSLCDVQSHAVATFKTRVEELTEAPVAVR
jgi:hypothetical protein